MEKIASHSEYLENLWSNFDITKNNIVYQNEKLIGFKNIIEEKEENKEEEEDEDEEKEEIKGKNKSKAKNRININFKGCHVAICQNGGLIAICKKKGFFDITKNSKINKFIIVMNQSAQKRYYIPIDWSYFKQYFVLLDFNDKEQLYGICNNASIFKIDILLEKAIPKITSEKLREETIFRAQLYKNGFIALTGEGKFYHINDIKNPFPELIIEMNSILKFSNNIEFLVIPEEVSNSKAMELLITNEKSNGIVHVIKPEDGAHYIEPIDIIKDNNTEITILGYKKISLLYKDKLETLLSEEQTDNNKLKNKNSINIKDNKKQFGNMGKIIAMTISPSKKNIALYNNQGIIYFFSSTFDSNLKKLPRIKVEIEAFGELKGNDMIEHQMLINYSKDFQFLFCGEDTVALYGLRLIFLINKSGNKVEYKITEMGEADAIKGKLFAKLIQEVDGIRYITNDGIFFISQVKKDLLDICDPFSKSASKKLLQAYEYYNNNAPNTEKTIREMSFFLAKAIPSLQKAAGSIFWTSHNEDEENEEKKELQLFLLKAAQFGKVYLNQNESEFNYDKFVEKCKDIKCVNNLRNHSKYPKMLTMEEYKNMEPKDLIKKLMRNLNFGMAFELCHFLDYSDKKVYQQFAIAKIKKISKNTNTVEEEQLADRLIQTLKDIPKFSFVKLAKKAFKYKKKAMGYKFLECEKSVLYRLPQYIELNDWDRTLMNIKSIYDRNVVNTVLHKIFAKDGIDDFINYTCKYPYVKSAVISFLRKKELDYIEKNKSLKNQDPDYIEKPPDYIRKYIKRMDNHEEKLYYYLEKYFSVKDLNDRKKCLDRAKECIKLIDNSKYPNFDSKFYKNYIESLENNIIFKTNKENQIAIIENNDELSFDISIYDVYKIIINRIREDKSNLFEKYNGKNFGFSQEGMNILKLIVLCETDRFPEMDLFLKKYNNLKKLFLTNLNVVEIYYEFKQYDKAVEYLKNVTETIYLNYKVNMLLYIEFYENALEVIFSEKKITNIAELVQMILSKKPNLKPKVDELSEKYKIKLQFS